MDTKLKNSSVPLWALVSFVVATTIFLVTAVNIYENREKLEKDNYFQSDLFYNELSTFAELVKAVNVDFAGYENKSGTGKVDKNYLEQLNQQRDESLRVQEQDILAEYTPRIHEAQTAGNKQEVARLTAEKDSRLAQMRANIQATWDRAVKENIANRDQEYEERKNSLALRDSSIKYYVQDKKANKVYTNLDHEPTNMELQENSLFFIQFPQTPDQKNNPFSELNRFFQLNQWKGVFYVPLEADGYSQIHEDAIYYDSIRSRLLKECVLLAVSFLIVALLLWHMGLQKAGNLPMVEKSMGLLRRIPLDIRIVLLFPLGLFYLVMLFNANLFTLPIRFDHVFTLAILSALTAYFLLHLAEAWRMCKHPETLRQQWQNSFLIRQKTLLTESFANRGLFFKTVLVAVLTLGLGMSVAIGWVALVKGAEELLLLSLLYAMFYLLMVLPYILRRLGLLNRIMIGAAQMAAGNLDTTIEAKHGGKLADLAHSLNNIKKGLRQSVEGQMKSERLKSELITNVSHDLKTPLTSIINYVNLLKREDLTPDDLKHYVSVLERKTDRLKVLIDDLFEASKMASGAVELNIEQVNVAALLNQAIGEFSDKIEQSSLTFRVNIEKQKIYAPLDGKKTWRVFENLISNALKYSMPNTRVHISLSEQANDVVLTMKNVSAYEIDFDASELFERFKRADPSRNTEGSGLGLAIAKSIVELQGGQMSIDIDGDYFKVIVRFRRQAK